MSYEIQVVSSAGECRAALQDIRALCRGRYPAVGFDCEWNTYQGGRGPVALLQLAAPGNLCVLLQLQRFYQMPSELYHFLNDGSILKVGVATAKDAQYLHSDYGLDVCGSVDLRFLAEDLNVPKPHGIAGLAGSILGEGIIKDWRIAASNWEANLTDAQIQYAAQDAIIGVRVYNVLKRQLNFGYATQYADMPYRQAY